MKTCIFEKNAFYKEGLKSILSRTEYEVVSECSDTSSIPESENNKDIDLVIFGLCDQEEQAETLVRTLKAHFPSARVVLLSSKTCLSCIITVFTVGADGLIPRDISEKALLSSLDLVMSGEKVFPTCLASFLQNGTAVPGGTNGNGGGGNLSEREIEIVRHLANGESNKLIAKHLDITESTVKVHLKTILRKLGLHNRTQAAMWAVSHGLANNEAEPTVYQRPFLPGIRPVAERHFPDTYQQNPHQYKRTGLVEGGKRD